MTFRFKSLIAMSTLVSLLALTPSEGWSKRKKGPPTVVQNAEAYAATDRARAIGLLEDALAGRKDDKDTALIMLHAGEQRRLNGDVDMARDWFSKVLQLGPAGEQAPAARLGQALIMASDGTLSARVLNTLRDVADRDVLDTQNADRYLYLAVDAASKRELGRVTNFTKKALDFARSDAGVYQRVSSSLQTLAETPSDEVSTGLVEGLGGPLEKAIDAYIAGDFELARRMAGKAAGNADVEVAERAEGLIRSIDGPVDANLIAVLLPLSETYAAVGRTIQTAFEYGYGRAPARLRFIDTGSTAETAAQALERAVLDDGAIAVVGPLLTVETDAVVRAAERLAVPLVSLSQSFEHPEDGIWGFQAMYTRGDQIEALLDWTMGVEGMSSFAVFHPDNEFGMGATELFEEGVLARGGQIMAQGAYSAEEGDLQPFAREFGTREGDDETLAQLRGRARRDGGNPNTVVLPPLIDFDALFLPENARRTPIATAALAYEEFPMGTFQPNRGKPEVPLLGMSTWNLESLVATGNQYTRNSRFPDVYSSPLLERDDPVLMEFKDALGKTPTALEVAAYDAARLVAAAAELRPAHRGAFRQALLDVEIEDSITGASGFDPETQRARRNMLILTLTRSAIKLMGEVPLHGATPREYPNALGPPERAPEPIE